MGAAAAIAAVASFEISTLVIVYIVVFFVVALHIFVD